ncbi:MAG TPA: OsmC family protein [Anaeromyxobacteraceae bacterium]|nr:OsmC family protein [Anaeromyxobacteraceae bacterium]
MSIKSIDSSQLAGFNKQYNASPASFMLGIEAKSIWEGQGLGNLAKVGRWTLGGKPMVKPTRDFSVQIGSWQEVGEAVGVERSSDRIEPVEAALAGLCSCVSEAITLNCARLNVNLDGLEVSANLEVDPGPIVGAKDPKEWNKSLDHVNVEVVVHGKLSPQDKTVIEDGATRSPVHNIFSRALKMNTNYRYVT